MNYKLILSLVFVLMFIPMVIAEPDFTFKSGEEVDLKVPVYLSDGNIASSTTLCNITVRNPTEQLMIQNEGMTFNNGGIYNYTIPASNLSLNGEYPTNIACSNSSEFGFTSFTFEINPSGNAYIPGITGPLLFGAILTLMFISVMLFIFAAKTELIPMKVFLMILSAIFAILNIGFIVGSFQEFLSTNSTLTNAFGAFYIVFISLVTAGSIFVMIWLLLVAFKLYKIKRGLHPGEL